MEIPWPSEPEEVSIPGNSTSNPGDLEVWNPFRRVESSEASKKPALAVLNIKLG